MPLPPEWIRFAPKPRPLAGGDAWNVFLSYRSVNRPWVLNLYDVLREQGHVVFLDQCVLKAGDRLIGNLQSALTTSQSGVLIWSQASSDSDWVQREYETMERQASGKRGFQFVPVRLDKSNVPDFAANRIFLDFSAYPDGPNGGELLRLLHAVVGVPLSPEAAHFANEQDEAAQRDHARSRAAIANGDHERLKALFAEETLPWRTSAALGCLAAEGLTKLKKYDETMQMLETLERRFPKAVRPRQLRALALARRASGDDLPRAQELLGELYESGERDPETVGIYARTWMDRYAASGDPGLLKRSRDLYAEAFECAQDDYYTGINAAAKSVLLGDPEDLEKAAAYAQRVEGIVGAQPHPRDYWKTATVAEHLLIQRRFDDAAHTYRAAVDMAVMEIASQETTWRQACRLQRKLQAPSEAWDGIRKAFVHLAECSTIENAA